ncbi:MAG: hypothetical protein CM1200mP12_08160 [Gammaproteobacteria bacterium]|nr:MAG: hypothetical protein CM1200mP12_08160 [Gammaproteobacteria bacterium]
MRGKNPQHYGIGFKEVWDLKPELHEEGLVIHTLGWPPKELYQVLTSIMVKITRLT